jgi:hypothetical protein
VTLGFFFFFFFFGPVPLELAEQFFSPIESILLQTENIKTKNFTKQYFKRKN